MSLIRVTQCKNTPSMGGRVNRGNRPRNLDVEINFWRPYSVIENKKWELLWVKQRALFKISFKISNAKYRWEKQNGYIG